MFLSTLYNQAYIIMHKETRNAIFIVLIVNVAIQIFFSLFFFSNNADSIKYSTGHTANTGPAAMSPDLLQELQNISYKLDIQNQLIADITHQDIEKIKTQTSQATPTAKLTETEILEQKQALINEMNNYGMTMHLFLADPRFQSLPSRNQSEVLSELARRLDNNEINKKEFLPGYKE